MNADPDFMERTGNEHLVERYGCTAESSQTISYDFSAQGPGCAYILFEVYQAYRSGGPGDY